MELLWFIIIALMLVVYVVLDGFDIGAGVVHLFVAKTNRERQMVLRAIGPVWDGNEVWLLAAGGTLYFAFPLLYASSFSGFYLPLMMVLWLLMLRAIGIEFRSHISTQVWRNFFDGVFAGSSILLAIFFGAALGNVVRGVPLNPDGYFFEALWTNWRVGSQPGILDWYTVLAGVVALVTLAMHGAAYLAMKTEDEVNERARRIMTLLWPAQLAVTFLSLLATIAIQPRWDDNYRLHPIGLLIPVIVFASLAGLLRFHVARQEKKAFLCSATYITAMLGGAAFALFPYVLPASTDPAYSLTVYNTAAGAHGLRVGLVWWSIGMVIAIAYFVFVYRMFRGKVRLEAGAHD